MKEHLPTRQFIVIDKYMKIKYRSELYWQSGGGLQGRVYQTFSVHGVLGVLAFFFFHSVHNPKEIPDSVLSG